MESCDLEGEVGSEAEEAGGEEEMVREGEWKPSGSEFRGEAISRKTNSSPLPMLQRSMRVAPLSDFLSHKMLHEK
jgi:hypothetical protein